MEDGKTSRVPGAPGLPASATAYMGKAQRPKQERDTQCWDPALHRAAMEASRTEPRKGRGPQTPRRGAGRTEEEPTLLAAPLSGPDKPAGTGRERTKPGLGRGCGRVGSHRELRPSARPSCFTTP